jgi:hypothetical protein
VKGGHYIKPLRNALLLLSTSSAEITTVRSTPTRHSPNHTAAGRVLFALSTPPEAAIGLSCTPLRSEQRSLCSWDAAPRPSLDHHHLHLHQTTRALLRLATSERRGILQGACKSQWSLGSLGSTESETAQGADRQPGSPLLPYQNLNRPLSPSRQRVRGAVCCHLTLRPTLHYLDTFNTRDQHAQSNPSRMRGPFAAPQPM